jgi:PAS domain S-box-containing protein
LQARVYANDYTTAIEAASHAQRLLWTSPSFFEVAEYHFYDAVARAAAHDAASTDERHEHLAALAIHYKQLAAWAENCPANFANRAALVAAEIARIEDRALDAMQLYERAIQSAREHGFVQNEGLAHEVAARFYAARGFETIAHAYRRHARYCYLRWGADGKVRQLEQLYPQLREDPTPAPATPMFGAPVAQLDAGAVVKASHAISGEIVLGKLVDTLMTIALEDAGAERGLLILLRGGTLQIEAEAHTDRKTVEVTLRQDPVTAEELPESVLHTVIRTRESVILDDASARNQFSVDSYIRRTHVRSVLCLPLVKQAALIGVLYLENSLASHAFTPARISVLELLSSQAAISLENARLYADLLAENRDRKRAEDELRRSEASLIDAQQISHTGSWRWTIDTGEVRASSEHFRIFGFDPTTTQLSYATFVERIAPDDRAAFEDVLARAVRQRTRFQYEYRILLPDGSVKHLQSMGRPDVTVSGEPEYVGVVMDVTERRQAEEALRDAQAELTRVARLTTMGELAASIAHEINQPLAAIVSNGSAGLRWLNRETPDLDEAREALSRMVSDGQRAGDVIRGLRALTKKSGLRLTTLDIDDTIREVLALTHSEVQRHGVVLRTTLAAGDRPAVGDRVQLQQVLLNLILNGIDAMKGVTDTKELTVSSTLAEPGSVLVSVEDSGPGLDPAIAERIFEPFVTTKADGLGMGLSICRSIIDAHGGRLWASPRVPHGTDLRFTVPTVVEA